MNKNSERLLREELEELLEKHESKLTSSPKITARYLMECIDSANNFADLIKREEMKKIEEVAKKFQALAHHDNEEKEDEEPTVEVAFYINNKQEGKSAAYNVNSAAFKLLETNTPVIFDFMEYDFPDDDNDFLAALFDGLIGRKGFRVRTPKAMVYHTKETGLVEIEEGD